MHFCNLLQMFGSTVAGFLCKIYYKALCTYSIPAFSLLLSQIFHFTSLISRFLLVTFPKSPINLYLTPKFFISHSILSIVMQPNLISSQSLPSPPSPVSAVILLHRSPPLYSSITDLNFRRTSPVPAATSSPPATRIFYTGSSLSLSHFFCIKSTLADQLHFTFMQLLLEFYSYIWVVRLSNFHVLLAPL